MKNTQIIQFEDIVNIPDLKSVYCNGALGVKFKEQYLFVNDERIINIDQFQYHYIGKINDIEIFVDPYKAMIDFRIHINKPTHEYDITDDPYYVNVNLDEIL